MKLKPQLSLILFSIVAAIVFSSFSAVLNVSMIILPAFPLSLAYCIRYGKSVYISSFFAAASSIIPILYFSVFFKYTPLAYVAMALGLGLLNLLQAHIGSKIYKFLEKSISSSDFKRAKSMLLTLLTVSIALSLLVTVASITSGRPFFEALAISANLWTHSLIGYITLTPFTLYLLKYYSITDEYKQSYMHMMFLILGLVSYFSIFIIDLNNQQNTTTLLQRKNEKSTTQFSKILELLRHDMASLQSMYKSSNDVDLQEFKLFNERALENSEIIKSLNLVWYINENDEPQVGQRLSQSSSKAPMNKTFKNHVLRYSVKGLAGSDDFKLPSSLEGVTLSKAKEGLYSVGEDLIYSIPLHRKGKYIASAIVVFAKQDYVDLVISDSNYSKYEFELVSNTGESLISDMANGKNRVPNEKTLKTLNLITNGLYTVYFEGHVPNYSFVNQKSNFSYWFFGFILLVFSTGLLTLILTLTTRDVKLTTALKQMKSEVKLRLETEKRLQVLNRDLEREIFKRTQEMRERNMELESIFQAFPDILFRLEEGGMITSYEAGESNNFYLDERLLVGQNIKEILAKDVSILFEEKISKAISTSSVQTVSYSQVFGGFEKYFEARFTKYSNNKVLVIVRDVSDLVSMEEKIREQNLLAIKNAKMVSLGEMAGGIAHEINNPLTIIDGSASIISALISKDEFSKDKIHESVNRISSTVKRIARIVSGLRKFARDGSADDYEDVVLSEFLSDTLGLCSERFRNHGVELIVNSKFEPGAHFEGRGIELSQVLINLLNNAFDAVKTLDKRWVKLETYIDSDNVYIEVTDSGSGIPKEIRDKIMQPFFTTKEIGEGTGLGLSISKGIVEHHNGQLLLDESSKNTVFRMILPRAYSLSSAA